MKVLIKYNVSLYFIKTFIYQSARTLKWVSCIPFKDYYSYESNKLLIESRLITISCNIILR